MVGTVLLVSLGFLLADRSVTATEQDRSALGRLLGFRGPVRRMVETETPVDGSALFGDGRTQMVTEVSRDGATARVVLMHTYRDRKGKTTTTRTERRYVVSGSPGREEVRESSRSAEDRSETVSTFEGPCQVKSLHHLSRKNDSFSEVTETKCDRRGRTLEQVTRRGETVISRATFSWFPGRWAFLKQWNASLGGRPAYRNDGFLRFDAHGNSLSFDGSLADLRQHYTYDRRGNWTWRKTEILSEVPLGDINTRDITYWDEE
ncbi:hypothetical protein [Deinococcus planocerae]|uniref:hypothetical protein n=1 Tax=Deinococcus planocerae TaxID=1737569 RepID=UPI000C7E9EEE|nr:hypothetical protein [Deinococcus planocerae]